MAFMGVTYYVIPLIFRKQIAFYRWRRSSRTSSPSAC